MKKSSLGIIAATLLTLSIPAFAADKDDAAPASDDQTSAGDEQKAAPAEHTSVQVIEFLNR